MVQLPIFLKAVTLGGEPSLFRVQELKMGHAH